ncbi:MAG: hypothetical protein QOC94_4746 [Actinoplanes sp.]|nr:hypothetical protein [Actinoplanes sp.]
MQRWIWWLMPPYGAKVRRRQALAELRRWQDEERAAARDRLIGVAQILDQPTAVHPTVRPLLTRGQAARTGPAVR